MTKGEGDGRDWRSRHNGRDDKGVGMTMEERG